ncbi:hypothetical protein BN2475_1840003 [Paraburkholderia ribeironis]|uniref:Uncharacterized protein n=1 Tax=Paraburkholderia ribeironis TaxID=1247936 RepID=A0A1N7SQS9_9BURK|nr:hypothetical protein BN2475_1840003 [Paraburkholderia ribeironis]
MNQLLSQLKTETTALQLAIDKYVAAAKDHFGKVADIDRLRIHVKDNIIYYMQAIWTYEPPDQRYFRLYDIDVPVFSHQTTVSVAADESAGAVVNSALDASKAYLAISDFPQPKIEDRRCNAKASPGCGHRHPAWIQRKLHDVSSREF